MGMRAMGDLSTCDKRELWETFQPVTREIPHPTGLITATFQLQNELIYFFSKTRYLDVGHLGAMNEV